MAKNIWYIIKRRKGLLFLTLLFFVLLSVGSLYVIDPRYESSISILVQKEESIDPLAFYDMDVSVGSPDRLVAFNEIIYSRSTLEKLIDSLKLAQHIRGDLEKQALVDEVRNNIVTSSKASDTFEITYYNTNPRKARDGVALLANDFIQTRQKLERRRKDETIKFIQNKIEELEKIVENQRDKIVNTTAEQLKEQPLDQGVLQTRLQEIDNQLVQLEWQLMREEDKLNIIKKFLNQDSQNLSLKPLYKLSLEEVTLGKRLGELLESYETLKQNFTDAYPELRLQRGQIIEIVRRIEPAIESNLSNFKRQQQSLTQKRSTVINDMEMTFVANQRTNTQQSNISIYQDLYDEMKLKLEQTKISDEIGDKATVQYVIIDQPYVAREASFPKPKYVIIAGAILGIIFGVIFTAMAESFDTTIRREEDLELQKPIIAYLTDGKV